jgi:hypothetical protein
VIRREEFWNFFLHYLMCDATTSHMRNYGALISLVLLVVCMEIFSVRSAFSDTGSAADQTTEGSLPGFTTPHVRRGRGSRKSTVPADDAVKGHCTVVESTQNPIASACVSLMLILKDGKGTEVSRTRTTPSGSFEFDLPDGKPDQFSIDSGSPSYKVISWARASGHQAIDLKLQLQ